MSDGIAKSIAALGVLRFGRLVVTSADLTAADGLLTIDMTALVPGAWIEIESGSTLRGIRILGMMSDDETDAWDDRVSAITIVASPASPYDFTIKHEDTDAPAIAAKHRMWCPSQGTPGTFGDATVTQHQVTIVWDPSLGGGNEGRWRVPWSVA